MLIGPGFNRLEQRITKALCSRRLSPKEAIFLHSISGKIESYRERATLSDKQAGWLYTILTNFEQGTKGRSSKSRTPADSNGAAPPPSSSENASESLRLERASPVSTASIGLTRNRRGRSTSAKHLSQRHRPKFSSSLGLSPPSPH